MSFKSSPADPGWMGVDFDGTLAQDVDGDGFLLGEPIPVMVARVKAWLKEGREVRIVTARANPDQGAYQTTVEQAIELIKAWCLKHIGQELPVTCSKDYRMVELWDDRVVRVQRNTGRRI